MLSIDELLAPVPGETPAGANLEYESVYDEIREARREELDLPQGDWARPRKTADWRRVAQLAGDTLARRSKDLQLAIWVAEAALRLDGMAGLRQGLELLTGVLDRFWDNLYPELEDGDAWPRAQLLKWVDGNLAMVTRFSAVTEGGYGFGEYHASRQVPTEEQAKSDSAKKQQRAEAIAEQKLTPEEFEEAFAATSRSWYTDLAREATAALAQLNELEAIGRLRFSGDAPVYGNLRQALEEFQQTAGFLLERKGGAVPSAHEPSPVPAPGLTIEAVLRDDGAETGAPTPPVAATMAFVPRTVEATPVPANATAADSAGGPLRSRDDAAARIAAAAEFIRGEDATDPTAYLLLRGFRWGELRARAPEIPPRLLVAPPTETRTGLKTLLLDSSWSALLARAEEVMATAYGRGWLDLQRYTVTACEGLGSEYDRVAEAVRGAIRALLTDLPQLASMTLMDDTPTANAETLRWLHESGLMGPDGGAAGVATPPSGSWRGAGDPFERALERARAGEPQKGIELLMVEADRERSERGRFLRRSQAARIMVDAGMENVATPILQEMLQLVDKHGLEAWEAGETVAEPLSLLYRCLSKRDGDASEAQGLYVRVCRLDPIQAVRLAPEAGNGE